MSAHPEVDRLGALYGVDQRKVEQLRMPPQSVDAEQSVLGGLMLRADAWHEIADLIDESDFYRRDHGFIFRAIKHLAGKDRSFDPVTLGDWLDERGHGEALPPGYLIELSTTTPSAANIRAYAQIVADKATLRRMIEVGTQLVNDGFQPDGRDVVTIAGEAQTKIAGLLDNAPCDLESMVPVMQRVYDNLQARYDRGGGIDGLSTGFDEFDSLLNGLKPGLYVLAARPKMGKTTLAQNIAEHVAINLKGAVSVFSLEMKSDALGERMLASVGNIDANRIRRGELDDADWSSITRAIKKIQSAQIFISKPQNARAEHIIAQARRQHAKTPLKLIVIDYLQLMSTGGDNRAQGLGEASRAITLMSHELGVPVLLLSQLNRGLEARTDKRPIPSDLRDTGALEQDADAVIFIYRDEEYNKDSRWRGTAEIIVALQRNGPAGDFRLKYRPDRFRFENLPEDWEPEPAPEKPAKAKSFRKMAVGATPRADIDG